MWNKPYTLKEGTAIVAGLLVTGGLLQVTLGPLEWGLFAWPANFITLILFVFLLIVAFLLRKRSYFCLFMSTMQAAIPAIAAAAILTLIMGVTKQVAEGKRPMGSCRTNENAQFLAIYLSLCMDDSYRRRGHYQPDSTFLMASFPHIGKPCRVVSHSDMRHTR